MDKYFLMLGVVDVILVRIMMQVEDKWKELEHSENVLKARMKRDITIYLIGTLCVFFASLAANIIYIRDANLGTNIAIDAIIVGVGVILFWQILLGNCSGKTNG